MATLLGAPARPDPPRGRWAGSVGIVLGVGALGAVFALAFGRCDRALSPWAARATAEIPAVGPPTTALPLGTADNIAQPDLAPAPSLPAPVPAPAVGEVAATDVPEPAPEAPRPLPPVVLYVEPPIDLGATDGGAVSVDAGASTDAGVNKDAAAATDAGTVGDGGAVASASASAAPAPSAPPPPLPISVPPYSVSCGTSTCNVGEVCCNPSCGTCARPGERCDERPCPATITYPESQLCGMQTCNVGLSCCNASCGICAPPGEPCSQAPCS